jgi:Holliday junction resolvase-like predicted endonuclease
MHRKHRGTYNELRACAWLLNQGYEVYRNISSYGLIDIIAEKDNVIHKFDVKSCIDIDIKKTKSTQLSLEQVHQGIKALYIDLNGRCYIEESPILSKKRQFCIVCCEYLAREFQKECCSPECRIKLECRAV